MRCVLHRLLHCHDAMLTIQKKIELDEVVVQLLATEHCTITLPMCEPELPVTGMNVKVDNEGRAAGVDVRMGSLGHVGEDNRGVFSPTRFVEEAARAMRGGWEIEKWKGIDETHIDLLKEMIGDA